MALREESCCFTGHRPKGLPWGADEGDGRCLELKYRLAHSLEALYARGFRHFICGMALGCDMYFAEAVLALRELHPEVTLEAAVPCKDQARRWSASQRQRYEKLLSQCDGCTVLQESYSPGCMQRRNRYMVDRSSLVLSAYTGQSGGTMSTLLYARRQGLELEILDIEI